MKIGICDDKTFVAEELKYLIEKYMEEKEAGKEEYYICCFSSGLEMLKYIPELDIVFLDIIMSEMDGIKIGNKVKELNPHCKVVVETGHMECFKEAFRFGAFRFITKPFNRDEIWEALNAALNERLGMKVIELYKKRNQYSIMQRDIQYIMAYNGYTEFFVKNEKYRKETTLKKLEESLDHKIFFQVNRTYIVNMFWIKEIKDNMIKVGDKQLYVSRRNKKEFEKKYLLFQTQ